MKQLFLAILVFTCVFAEAQITVEINGPTTANVNETKNYTLTWRDGFYQISPPWDGTPNWFTFGGSVTSGNESGASVQWTSAGIHSLYFEYSTWNNFYSDNLTVTINSEAPNTPGTIFTTTQNCNSTTVQRNSNPPSGVEWYWQTSSSGTTTLLGSSNSITRTAGGNLYLRARNSSGTWSTSSQSVGNLSIVTPPAAPANATHGDIISNTGGQVPLSVSSVSGATAYRWYTVASGGTPISGATTTTYSPTVTTTTTYYAEAVTGNCASTSRTAVTANVHPTPQIIGNTTITMGEPVTLSLNYTYDSVQWRRNGADIAGATQPTYTATEPGTYSVQVEKGSATPASSSTKTVTTGPYGQNRNFIVSNTILTAGITDAAAVDNLPVEHNAQTIQYFDGLGRPIQTVTTQGSPDKKDIVQPIVYDAFGREAVKYLPYVADDVTGWYKTDPVGMVNNYVGSPHHQFYTNANTTIARDAQPYAVTIFEPSPLNRVIKQGAPGTTWQPNSEHSYNATDHTIKFDYAFNEANEVLLWSYTYPTTPNSFGLIAAGTTTAPVYYEANQLYKNKTKDEQGHEVIEYKDKQGRVVLKRVQAVDTPGALTGTNKDIHYASTYYIYDDFNNLVCVIQPEGTKNINQYLDGDDTVKENFLNRWAFRYHYDGRRRMIIKQVPGAGKVYMVYDKRDRLVMTQDANQRATHQWLFTKYDALNRPVLTGIQTVATGIAQDSMQTLVNTYYANLTTNNGAWYETFDPAIAGNVHGYSNRSFPLEAAANNYLTVMYYDRYDFKTLLAGSERYDYKNDELTTQPATAFNRVTGQVTGTKTKVLNGGTTGFTWLHTVNYYDDRYRVIQAVTDNYKNGYDRITNRYDFVGKVLETRTTHFTNDLHWTDLVGATWYNERLTRTAPNAGWGTSGAASAEMLPANTDGWFEFVPIGINRAYMIGFSPTNADAGYASIKYAYFINNNGTLQIRENGSSTNLLGTVRNYVAGDVFRVERKNGKINYYHNSTLLLQRDAINDALLIDASLNGSSMSITGFRASFGTPETHSTTRRFVYDHAGRLLKTYHQLDAHDEILLSENQYNELGELITKKLHSTDDTHFKQHADYRYNIRGWLTRMNNAALTPDDSNEPRDLFGFELGYEQLLSGLSTAGQLQYNGNISAMKWSSNLGLGDTQQDQVTQRGYAFDYDPLNRLKAASHKEHTGTWNATTAFHENNLTYDLNGNIKTLNRTGKDGSAMDVLSYNYGNTTTVSNRLLRVTDTGDKTAGFKDGYPSDVDYAYDSNGNLIWDRNKGGIDVAKNGDFANGTTDWTITDTESRLSVANNELTITAGTTTAELSQQDLVEGSKYYIAIIDLERTAGSVTVSLGGSTPVTLSTTSVHHRPIRSSNANKDLVITFSADFAGKIKRVELKGVTVITYNHLNLPDVVTRAGDKHLKYIYDATGRKLAQVLGTAATHEKRTEYNGEYIYENDTLKLINHEEGRIIPDSLGQAYYEYHLKDHLGNVRLTFTTKHEVEENTATLETAQAEEESGQFLYYDEAVKVNAPLFDHTNTGATHYAARLNGTAHERYGLAKSLSVMPGDTIKAEVYAKYIDTNTNNWTQALTDLMTAMATGTAPAGTVVDGGLTGSTGGTTPAYIGLLNKSGETGPAPKAYLNYLVFDRDYNILNGGFMRVSEAAVEHGQDGVHEKLATEFAITQPGYVYIYLSNENETPVEVYFDDFSVQHIKSPVIQVTDLYPYGAVAQSYSRENSLLNRYLYQSKEYQDELDLNLYDFHLRQYDPWAPHTTTIDPGAESYYSMSPYSWAAGNPMKYIDPTGAFLDEWAYNYETKELQWISDKGGDEQQIVHVVDNEGKPVPGKSTAIIDGSSVHITELDNNVLFISSYDPVSGIPDGYNSNSGYNYNALDLKMRHRLEGTSFWPIVVEAESSGNAEPLHSKNAVDAYEQKYGTNSSFIYAIEQGYFAPAGAQDIAHSAHGAISKFGSKAWKSFNYQSRWKGSQPASANTNSWNQFLKDNKGKYSGKGWQKQASADYQKLKAGGQ